MLEISNQILALENDYELLINNFFKRMGQMPYETKEWQGNVAIKYVNLISLEKSDYMDFGKKIKQFGLKIKKDAEDIEKELRKNNVIEGQR